MKPDELNKLLQNFLGQELTTSISGNTIELWINKKPKEAEFQLFSIDPPWRIEKEDNIVASSADFPWEQEEGETEEQYKQRFNSACEKCHLIHKDKIKTISFCAGTADIQVEFNSGHTLRSFTTWSEEESWHYSNYKEKKVYYVTAGKIEVNDIA